MAAGLMNGVAPPGSLGLARESGWMTSDNFLNYYKHFINHVRPSKEKKVLLLLDNHASHLACRDNHIIMLGFLAHTSNKLQPLDVSVYGPLKTAYSYLTSHPGEVITVYQVASLFSTAYCKVANMKNALAGFRATGIEAAETTNNPLETSVNVNDSLSPTNDSSPPMTITSKQSVESAVSAPSSSTLYEPTSATLLPLPRAKDRNNKQQRQKSLSIVLTSIPVKDEIEERRNKIEDKTNERDLKELRF